MKKFKKWFTRNSRGFIHFRLRYQFLLAILGSIIVATLGLVLIITLGDSILTAAVKNSLSRFESQVAQGFELAKEYVIDKNIDEESIDDLYDLLNDNEDLAYEIYFADGELTTNQVLEDYEYAYDPDVVIDYAYFSNENGHFIIVAQTRFVFRAYIAIIIAAMISFVLFFIAAITLFVSRKEKYLTKIADQVNIISAGNLDNEIPVKGRDEIAFVAKNINEMSQALKEQIERERNSEKTKNELIANVSHDLRTPLTTITGYLSLIDENKDIDPELRDKYLKTALNKSKGLNELIEQLFEYVTLSNSDEEIELTEIDMEVFMEQVLFDHSFILTENGFRILQTLSNEERAGNGERENQTNVRCKINPDRINRVFDNVFANIIKHGANSESVQIRTMVENGDYKVRVSNYIMDDKVVGVPDNVFNRYFTTDRNFNESGGLGLSIVKEIMVKHGGKVSASYKEHQFIIDLALPIVKAEIEQKEH